MRDFVAGARGALVEDDRPLLALVDRSVQRESPDGITPVADDLPTLWLASQVELHVDAECTERCAGVEPTTDPAPAQLLTR